MSDLANLEDKVKLLIFSTDEDWQHVKVINPGTCSDCKDKQCLTVCPSGVFRWNYQRSDPILVLYKQCIECGSCRLVCSNIEFSYPHGGYGVLYHEG